MVHLSIREAITDSILLKQKLLQQESMLETIQQVIDTCIIACKTGKKILFCGNGGSAADAQHLAAELSGRFYYDRPPIDAEALHVNSSALTAIANDYSYDEIYSRMIFAKGHPGDVLFAISTSGNSPNILKAIDAARKLNMIIVGMTGQTGGRMASKCHFLLNVPGANTARIQEAHIMVGHIILEHVERGVHPLKEN